MPVVLKYRIGDASSVPVAGHHTSGTTVLSTNAPTSPMLTSS